MCDHLPQLVQNKIFLNLSVMPRTSKGWFYPPSVFRPLAGDEIVDQNVIISNQLRFCLIFPNFLSKLELDLDSLDFECLYLTAQFDKFKKDVENVIKKRIRLDTDIFRHNTDCYGRWIMYTTVINDFVQPREIFADWLFRTR